MHENSYGFIDVGR